MTAKQLSLFDAVKDVFASCGDRPISNAELYQKAAKKVGIPLVDLQEKKPIGEKGGLHSPITRSIRWCQQDMKRLGWIERVSNARGLWQLTGKGKSELRKSRPGVKLIAFSTKLGVAVWGLCEDVFKGLGEDTVSLCLTSPPYPLRQQRAYGNPDASEYVDFICRSLEPVVKSLKRGGSVVLNIGNDCFLTGSPARSTYIERMVIALEDRFGLYKMDQFVWHNPSKPPAPIQWASKQRMQLNTAWEPIYWFSNDPSLVEADNRRVLQPHTEKHLKYLHRTWYEKPRTSADGAYRISENSFNKVTAGRIPRNVLTYSHTCASQRDYKRNARSLGLPPHGAPFPLHLVRFLVEFLTAPGSLVVDPFSGSFTTGLAAELLGRQWIGSECMWEYVRGAATRFIDSDGFWMNPEFEGLLAA